MIDTKLSGQCIYLPSLPTDYNPAKGKLITLFKKLWHNTDLSKQYDEVFKQHEAIHYFIIKPIKNTQH